MSVKVYLYPLSIRVWHWTNAILCLLLILTGVSMQYSNPEYPFMRFDLAVSMHNISGILLTISYAWFIVANIVTGNNKYYALKIKGLKDRLMKQFRYYTVGLFTGQKSPFPINEKRKFNPLQKFSYVLIMFLVIPILFITGWALLFPEIILTEVFGISGIQITALLHMIMGFFVSVFMLVHIYFSTMGTTASSNFKAMFNGWHK
ncbi:MAG: cytochrome b/b6 domain-containing protein [Bacteroidota bacterium]|nr:cytochrome b/b6 domain-containing protein [Bacteroidota bacterium]